jgi:hypothetical protein
MPQRSAGNRRAGGSSSDDGNRQGCSFWRKELSKGLTESAEYISIVAIAKPDWLVIFIGAQASSLKQPALTPSFRESLLRNNVL